MTGVCKQNRERVQERDGEEERGRDVKKKKKKTEIAVGM
jgi:hypothetical protein